MRQRIGQSKILRFTKSDGEPIFLMSQFGHLTEIKYTAITSYQKSMSLIIELLAYRRYSRVVRL